MNITTLPEGSKYYVKKPFPVRTVQMTEAFTVETKEGVMAGKAGDYVIEGVFGEMYPCDKTIFENTYRKVKLTDRAAAETKRMFLMDR
jgi:hypothetical protein